MRPNLTTTKIKYPRCSRTSITITPPFDIFPSPLHSPLPAIKPKSVSEFVKLRASDYMPPRRLGCGHIQVVGILYRMVTFALPSVSVARAPGRICNWKTRNPRKLSDG